ncbi:MAG TPA: radical SAM protein [Desulfomonilaceae bacterium]|nr:radical SAM protein [Desulfomonilaceae bacterium]
MKVILVRPPFYALFGVTTPKMKTYPLNLLYLATFVRERSHHTAGIVDGENITVPSLCQAGDEEHDPEMIMHRGIPRMIDIIENPDHEIWVAMERAILAEKPDLVGFSCNSGNMDAARILVRRMKARGVPVILGGAHPTALPEQSMTYTHSDMVAVGEGELTLVRVMDSLEGKGSFSRIPSLVWKNEGRIRINPRGELITHIDELPIPDRSLVGRSDYFGEVLMTGRGCPFDCAYCASRTIWGKKVRLRSVSSIIEELHLLREAALASDSESGCVPPHERPGRWVVKVVDDTFTVNKKRTLDLLERIAGSGLNCFEFTGGVRADTLDETVVQRMREANFRRVTLGVESGSPKILRMVRKGETNEDVKRAIGLLTAVGIRSHAFFMIGFPGEDADDIALSKELILDARPDYVEINMVTPYPGTDLFPRLIDEAPSRIDRWYRWFHQGLATHSDRLGYDLDAAYEDFAGFARAYNRAADR